MTNSSTIPGISPKQLGFLLADTKEILYGGAAGGGKSEALHIGALQYVDDYPVSSLLLRRTYRDLDKHGGLMHRARDWLKGTDAHWDGVNYRWTFPSGAELAFGYIDHEGDELKFQSSEYDYVGFDELTHFPRHQYLYMYSRMRRLEGTPVGLRLRAGTNPGGPGHEWVRKRWDLPTGTHPDTGRIFISAGLRDNPFLKQDEYAEGLAQLGDVTRAQLLDGDWTATSFGGYFSVDDFKMVDWDQVPDPTNIAAIVRYWDFAATEESEMNPDPDYTVGLLLLQTVHGSLDMNVPDYYVLDVQRDRLNPGDVETLIKTTAKRDGVRVAQWLEQERGSAGLHLYRHYNETVLPEYRVRKLYVTGTKEANAKISAARVSEGRVHVLKEAWLDDFVAECGVFPLGPHDDQVDAFSKAMKAIEKERHMVDTGSVRKRSDDYRKVRRGRNARRKSHDKSYGY